jgi:hypothetical protein
MNINIPIKIYLHIDEHPNNSNDKPSKKSNNGGVLCTNCVKLNAGGETIPEYVMRNHTAANCRITKKGSSGSKAANKAPHPLSGMPLTAEQLTQVALILQTVQQVSAVTAAATSTKKSKKTSFKDEVSDSSSL